MKPLSICKPSVIQKIRRIIKKHNDEDRYAFISTIAPAKEIVDYIQRLIDNHITLERRK